ncbi:Tol-Pal system protein TolB [Aliarcobacter cibarius]|jgi:TolB protein|uniref:Tol-Pal system protein TolB n=1 Tax=Aliarcobacter cibarius TaxID=255507 RepID=A0A5J6RI71_9BACT|nr:Tol-Pal system protein TolB [Aliarcobacter cibarius]QEZ89622.1 Tol-Pal system translocation protein TolB [Aliarcobacter cibarius]QKJ27629.1 Tol-Pal system translocation protein TolB [Aliarcobacter cibarius]TLT00667.1 Tol-Pal system protein TolB [Aliarcobacter cibarius]TLT00961.1 Tol-Pal system protein TolB [Aliarcobacter cibarius]TLT03895.1 Tol-Pal system protein TolB [Aliarcobacter cibarius]
MFKIVLFISLMFSSIFANVDGHIDIVKKSNSIPKIAVSVASDSSSDFTLSRLKKSLEDDLNVSGHFDLSNVNVPSSSYDSTPDMLALSNQGVSLFVNLASQKESNGGYTLRVKLFDVNQRALVLEKNFTTSQLDRSVFLAHKAAISINDFFKAPSIAWMEKFVVFAVYRNAGNADIMIGDYTLTYKQTVVSGGLNIFPKWADKEQKSIYYTSYNYKKPTLVKLNIYNRSKDIIMDSDGMLACSDVNADGSKILVTASPTGQPDIFVYDTRSKNKTQITKYGGIDVGGQFVENDSKIVFVSDRLGNPNIFSQNIGSTAVERMVYHSNNNSSVTSNKNNIVFSSKDSSNELGGKSFNLYLINSKTDNMTRLTTNGVNQFPKFSPDGETLLFIKNYAGVSSLGIIRLEFNKSFLFPLKGERIQSIDW